jgi:hypothetical protein
VEGVAVGQFCPATLLARRLATKLNKNDPAVVVSWERSVRAMLATRLRLAPQARPDPKTIARMRPVGGIAPWHRPPNSKLGTEENGHEEPQP